MAIEAPCRSASLHGKAQRYFKVARHVGCARPAGARLPTPIILRRFAAWPSEPKACIGGNAIVCTLAVEYQSLRDY